MITIFQQAPLMKLEIILKSIDFKFENYNKNDTAGTTYHLEHYISIAEKYQFAPQYILFFVLHEMSHAISLDDFRRDANSCDLTFEEGMADTFSQLVATEYFKKNGATDEELQKAQKKFFEKHALRYRMHYSAQVLPEMLKDEHSVSKIRVNGMLQHMDTWYELYDVVEGDSLYLPAEERIVIW